MEISVVVAAAAADSPGAGGGSSLARPSRYESQKRRDWQTFGQYLRNHRPPLELSRCSGAHVLEFLRYLDQFGKTKVHAAGCPFFGLPSPPAPCPCPLRQAWGSLDALVGRLRAAFEEHGGGTPEANPFAARAVRLYLREVRDSQAKARGIAYEKRRRRRHPSAGTNKQAKQMQDHHRQQETSAAVAAPPDLAPHFLIPHSHFFHGYQYFPPATTRAADQAQAGGPMPAVGVAGEDMMLAMAADGHGAGYMMPLSVFH